MIRRPISNNKPSLIRTQCNASEGDFFFLFDLNLFIRVIIEVRTVGCLCPNDDIPNCKLWRHSIDYLRTLDDRQDRGQGQIKS